MATPHTPAPWICEAGYGNHGLALHAATGEALGHVRAFIPSGLTAHGMDVMQRWEEGHANARLIAAAPELLEALRQIVSLEGTEKNEWDAVERLIPEMSAVAQAAISKAAGPPA